MPQQQVARHDLIHCAITGVHTNDDHIRRLQADRSVKAVAVHPLEHVDSHEGIVGECLADDLSKQSRQSGHRYGNGHLTTVHSYPGRREGQ